MSRSPSPVPSRRTFIGQIAVAAAAVGAGAPTTLLGAEPTGRTRREPDDRWLDEVKGRHRQIFDMPQPAAGLPLIHVRNFLNTYKAAYGLGVGEVGAAAALYFMSAPLAFTDPLWAKYKLGEATGVVDAETNAAATRNVFWKPRGDAPVLPIGGGPVQIPVDTAITELQQRGTVFVLCNNAFNFWVGQIAAGSGQTAEAVRAEMEAHLIPGIHVVPAAVIAFNQAQERGMTYMFLP